MPQQSLIGDQNMLGFTKNAAHVAFQTVVNTTRGNQGLIHFLSSFLKMHTPVNQNHLRPLDHVSPDYRWLPVEGLRQGHHDYTQWALPAGLL